MEKNITKIINLLKAEIKEHHKMVAEIISTKIGDRPKYDSYRFEQSMKGLFGALVDELEKEI